MIRKFIIGGLIVMATATSTPIFAKDAPTYYTPKRIASAKRNVEKYQWAKKVFNQIKVGQGFVYYTGRPHGPADSYIEKDDQFMWMLMPTTKIPRFVENKYKVQSPGHTKELREKDPWSGFTINPLTHPYKVRCKVSGNWYPTNDYASGDMTSGDYPDDGNGCQRDGTTYFFLSEYAHMAYGSAVVPALTSLSKAWLMTGDKRYGRAGCILLAKLAMEYPNHDDRKDRLFYAKFPNFRDPNVSWKMGGMITDLIWETSTLEATAIAYDGLFSYMDKDPQMLTYLKAKGMPIETADDLRRYIEDNILRSGIEGLMMGNIHGNPGMHQAAALAVALVLDDYDDSKSNPFNSKTMVDYMVHHQHPQWSHVGHDAYLMTNASDRDGGGVESPNYSRSRLLFVGVNRHMDDIRAVHPEIFPIDKYPDLFLLPKARRIFDFYLNVTVHGYNLPSIGDSGGLSKPNRVPPQSYAYLPTKDFLYAFKKYSDPRYGRACTDFNTGELAEGSLFEHYPDEEIKKALADPASTITWKSRQLDGYGVSIFDTGNNPQRRAVTLNYTNLLGHAQSDQLTLGHWARGVNLLPDLGYPKGWVHRYTWDSNSLAHNTVTVDETQPTLSPTGGHSKLFAVRDGVHIVSAAHDPYPKGKKTLGKKDAKLTDLYQRTVVMVDIDEDRYYVVDHFAVNGGEQHDQSWHGPMVTPQPPDLDWQARPGTLAGPDVPQFGKWTDKWGRSRKDFPCYVKEIRTVKLTEPAAWTWPTGLKEGDTLRMHLVPIGGALQLSMGKGRSPSRPTDWSLDYLMARHQVKRGRASQFVTVIESYQKKPVIKAVRLISQVPAVIEVDYEGGTDRIEINVPLRASNTTTPQKLGVRVTRPRGDVRVGHCTQGPGAAKSQIKQVSYDEKRIAIPISATTEDDFTAGARIRIYNAGRSTMYQIDSVKRDGNQLWLTLDGTALVGMGKVGKVADGQLQLESFLDYANGTQRWNNFAGTWVGDDKSTKLVKGATHASNVSTIYLKSPVRAVALKKRFTGKMASVWQYGVRDKIELVRVESVGR